MSGVRVGASRAGALRAWSRAALVALPLWGAPLRAQVMDLSGPLVVSGIGVEGNRVTKERILLRELTLHEGDTMDVKGLYARIERSRQNLMNLGLFNTVSLLPTFLNEHEVFLTVTVNERWFWWPSPIFQFADPNFNTWWLTRDFRRVNFGAYIYRYNMRGMNETLYAKVQFGYAKEFALRYRFPFIDKRQRWGLSVGGGYAEQDEITIGTEGNKRILLKTPQRDIRTVRKADVRVSLRPAHDLRHYWRLSWTDARVQDTVVVRAPDYFAGGAGRRMTYFTLGYSVALDQRDSRAYPLSGTYSELNVDRYGLGFAGRGEPDVTTVYGTVQRAWRYGKRWSVGGSLRGKVSLGDGIPYYVQEGLGYDEYLRGYEYYIMDGQHYALGKANVLFALVQPREYRMEAMPLEPFRTLYLAVYLNAFVDVGRVWDDRYAAANPLSNTWQQGAGLGLDIVSSYDQVLRLEYAVNRLSETGFYLHFSQPF